MFAEAGEANCPAALGSATVHSIGGNPRTMLSTNIAEPFPCGVPLMISLIAHVTPAETPAGLLMFVAGMASGVALTALIWRFRRSR